jgi:L-proline---[L-prolyl-carrier protein] ligase
MPSPRALHQLLDQSAASWPERVAVAEVDGAAITYRALAALADGVRQRIRAIGVGPGDRVGIHLRKSIDAVAAIFGVLKAGAAYVPLDVEAPQSRNAYVVNDCALRALISDRRGYDGLAAEVRKQGAMPVALVLDTVGGGNGVRAALASHGAAQTDTEPPDPDAHAYVLYTSGSTGKPKGVVLSHRAALSFVDWCSDTFAPTREDRFGSHAPFHFDLSILDIYLCIRHGARLLLIPEALGKEPSRLAAVIAAERLSVWYSVPSVLTLLAQYGKLERHDFGAVRLVLFAGEVFPITHVRHLKSLLPHPRYFNLYGPTETNVCTSYELPAEISTQRTDPFPIGKTCGHLRSMVVDDSGRAVPTGADGELCIAGPAVMLGYWNLPEHTARAFLDDGSGERWYRTGDVVRVDETGNYIFRGRRDRMVKRRGYRVELGEVEAGLHQHPGIREAAAVAIPDDMLGIRIMAVVSCDGDRRPSIIELKRFCADVLPSYMIPDLFTFEANLPKTSNGKVDYQRLLQNARC